jgi:hypothetical protein
MPPEIHPLMENADDVDVLGCDTIKEKVRSGAVFVIASPHLEAWPSALRIHRYDVEVAR